MLCNILLGCSDHLSWLCSSQILVYPQPTHWLGSIKMCKCCSSTAEILACYQYCLTVTNPKHSTRQALMKKINYPNQTQCSIWDYMSCHISLILMTAQLYSCAPAPIFSLLPILYDLFTDIWDGAPFWEENGRISGSPFLRLAYMLRLHPLRYLVQNFLSW